VFPSRGFRRLLSVAALALVFDTVTLDGQALASPESDLLASESDDPALVRESERWFRRAERLAARARAILIPKRFTRRWDLGDWFAARSKVQKAAEEAYVKAVAVGYRANSEQWSGLSPRFQTRAALRYSELVLDFYLAVEQARLEWQKARQRKCTGRCCIPGGGMWSEGCESYENSITARGTLKRCVEFSTMQRHWDEYSEACEVLLAQTYRSEFRRLDELRPMPHWTALPLPRDPVGFGSEGELVRP
jgi:hypothetical protein